MNKNINRWVKSFAVVFAVAMFAAAAFVLTTNTLGGDVSDALTSERIIEYAGYKPADYVASTASLKDYRDELYNSGAWDGALLPKGNYDVSSVEALGYMRDIVEHDGAAEGTVFFLTSDVDFEGAEWRPIEIFNYKFDGRGYTIKNLTVKDDGVYDYGFFERIDGDVFWLTLQNVTVKGSGGEVVPYGLGALAGRNYGRIGGCAVIDATVNDLEDGRIVGGLVGINYGWINGCYVNGLTVTASDEAVVGGFVGNSNDGSYLDDCYTARVACASEDTDNYYFHKFGFGTDTMQSFVNCVFEDVEMPEDVGIPSGMNFTIGNNYLTADFTSGAILGDGNLDNYIFGQRLTGDDADDYPVFLFADEAEEKFVVKVAFTDANLNASICDYYLNYGDVVPVTAEAFVNRDYEMFDLFNNGDEYALGTPTYKDCNVRVYFHESFARGKGTEDAPFEIGTVQELFLLRDVIAGKVTLVVDGAVKNFVDIPVYVKLTADIALNDVKKTAGGVQYIEINVDSTTYYYKLADGKLYETVEMVTPIADLTGAQIEAINEQVVNWTDFAFTGGFDGNGHTISGLYSDGGVSLDAGFFSRLNGTVKNLTVDGLAKGIQRVAGIVAYILKGSGEETLDDVGVYNCVNLATVIGDEISRDAVAGGVVSYIFTGATIDGCVNKGQVSARCAGGIVGHVYGNDNYQVVNCVNEGKVSATEDAGGIMGYTSAEVIVTACINKGTITAIGDTYPDRGIGALVGDADAEAVISNCVGVGDIELFGYSDGLIVRRCEKWDTASPTLQATFDAVSVEYYDSDANARPFRFVEADSMIELVPEDECYKVLFDFNDDSERGVSYFVATNEIIAPWFHDADENDNKILEWSLSADAELGAAGNLARGEAVGSFTQDTVYYGVWGLPRHFTLSLGSGQPDVTIYDEGTSEAEVLSEAAARSIGVYGTVLGVYDNPDFEGTALTVNPTWEEADGKHYFVQYQKAALEGEGTKDKPFLIKNYVTDVNGKITHTDFELFREMCNEERLNNCEGLYFRLEYDVAYNTMVWVDGDMYLQITTDDAEPIRYLWDINADKWYVYGDLATEITDAALLASLTSKIVKFTTIDTFKGVLDGNGHTIDGMIIESSESDIGLFGTLYGTVKNLTVSGRIKGYYQVGAIAGKSIGGTIDNCTGYACVIGTGNNVGGFVGQIIFDTDKGTSTIVNSRSFGKVQGSYQVGGLVGYVQDGILIANNLVLGEVSGTDDVAGLIAYCFADFASGEVYNNVVAADVKSTVTEGYVELINNMIDDIDAHDNTYWVPNEAAYTVLFNVDVDESKNNERYVTVRYGEFDATNYGNILNDLLAELNAYSAINDGFNFWGYYDTTAHTGLNNNVSRDDVTTSFSVVLDGVTTTYKGLSAYVDASAVEKAGYYFLGWAESADATEAVIAYGRDTTLNGKYLVKATDGLTLYSIYKPTFEGKGTEDDPYQISNKADLVRLTALVATNNFDTNGLYFVQTADIELCDIVKVEGLGYCVKFEYKGAYYYSTDGYANWYDASKVALGNSALAQEIAGVYYYQNLCRIYEFSGSYDGNGFAIKGLFSAGGLFGIVYGAELKNITIDGAYILSGGGDCEGVLADYVNDSLVSDCTVKNAVVEINDIIEDVGGLIGSLASSTVTGCYLENVEILIKHRINYGVGGFIGNAQNCSIDDCRIENVKITISDNVASVGGFVGIVSEYVEFGGCVANGVEISVIECDVANAGGFIGFAEDTGDSDYVGVFDCESSFDIVAKGAQNAGFIAYAESSEVEIKNSGAVGTITLESNSSLGGIFGWLYECDEVTVTNCYAYVDFNLTSNNWCDMGGFSGYVSGVEALEISNFVYVGEVDGVYYFDKTAAHPFGYYVGGMISDMDGLNTLIIENAFVKTNFAEFFADVFSYMLTDEYAEMCENNGDNAFCLHPYIGSNSNYTSYDTSGIRDIEVDEYEYGGYALTTAATINGKRDFSVLNVLNAFASDNDRTPWTARDGRLTVLLGYDDKLTFVDTAGDEVLGLLPDDGKVYIDYDGNNTVYYTTDGTKPTIDSFAYAPGAAIRVADGDVLWAVSFDDTGVPQSEYIKITLYAEIAQITFDASTIVEGTAPADFLALPGEVLSFGFDKLIKGADGKILAGWATANDATRGFWSYAVTSADAGKIVTLYPVWVAADAVSVWDGVSKEAPAFDKDELTFTITSAAELAGLADAIEDNWYPHYDVEILVDIDLGWHNWTPIYADCDIVLYGNGHNIYNLYVDEKDEYERAGLFAFTNTLLVSDLGVIGADVYGYEEAGVFAAFVRNNFNVFNSFVESAYVITPDGAAGGFLGSTADIFYATNSYVLNTFVYGYDAGSLVGYVEFICDVYNVYLLNCSVAGKYAAQITGLPPSNFLLGNVYADVRFGGFGTLGTNNNVRELVFDNGWRLDRAVGYGGLENELFADWLQALNVVSNFEDTESSAVYSSWQTLGNLPRLNFLIRGSEYDVGDVPDFYKGSAAEWYLADEDADEFYISSAAELKIFEELVENGTYFEDKKVILTADIDMLGVEFDGIGECNHNSSWFDYEGLNIFYGTFDGNGFAIKNLDINAYEAGLFITLNGTVKNLTVYGRVYGGDAAAGIAAIMTENAKIENCVNYCTVGASVYDVAGIASQIAYGSVINHCVNYGNLTGSGNEDYTGGIVSYVSNEGSGPAAYVLNSVNYGTVKGSYVGGILGYVNNNVRVINCVNAGAVSGYEYVGGIVGRVNGSGEMNIEGCVNYSKQISSYYDDDFGALVGYLDGTQHTISSFFTVPIRPIDDTYSADEDCGLSDDYYEDALFILNDDMSLNVDESPGRLYVTDAYDLETLFNALNRVSDIQFEDGLDVELNFLETDMYVWKKDGSGRFLPDTAVQFYGVEYKLSKCRAGSAFLANNYAGFGCYFDASLGYVMPDEIVVKVGGTILRPVVDYTWTVYDNDYDERYGMLRINPTVVDGDIVIEVACVLRENTVSERITLFDGTTSTENDVGGTVTFNKTTASYPDTVSFTVAANTGYKIKSVTGAFVGDESNAFDIEFNTDTNAYEVGLSYDLVVTVEFEKIDYVINVYVDNTLNATLSGNAQVGDVINTAGSDYAVVDYTVSGYYTVGDGTEKFYFGVGATFIMPAANINLYLTYTSSTATPSVTTEFKTTAAPSGVVATLPDASGVVIGLAATYASGDTVTFTVEPSFGCYVALVMWSGDDGVTYIPLTADELSGAYSFAMPDTAAKIEVTVEKTLYEINNAQTSADYNLTGVRAETPDKGAYGDVITIGFAGTDSQRFGTVSVTDADGNPVALTKTTVSGADAFTFVMPASNVEISVAYLTKSHAVSLDSIVFDAVTVTDLEESALVGADVTFNIVAKKGYIINKVYYLDTANQEVKITPDADGNCLFAMPNFAVTIRCVINPIVYDVDFYSTSNGDYEAMVPTGNLDTSTTNNVMEDETIIIRILDAARGYEVGVVQYSYVDKTGKTITVDIENKHDVFTFDMPAYDIMIKVNFVPVTYTLTFDTDGGGQLKPAEFTIKQRLTLVSTFKKGYLFSGWTLTSGALNDGTVIYAAGSEFGAGTIIRGYTGNATLTAVWTKCNHALSASTGTVVEPTCTERGYTSHTCDVCGDSYVTDYTDALGHDYVIVVTAPTCTERGYTTHTCSRCGDSYVDTYVNALGHTWGAWTEVTPATCTVDGVEERVCAHDANHVETRAIPADGHVWGEWTESIPATCTEKGYETRVCTTDGTHVEGRYINVLGHSYTIVVTPPTCTERGYTTHICSRCGDSYVDTYVDALGHSKTHHAETAATCSATGNIEYWYCSVCDKYFSDEACLTEITLAQTVIAINPTAHEWGNWTTVAPNVELKQDGYDIRVCAHDSNHTEKRNIVAWESVVQVIIGDEEPDENGHITIELPDSMLVLDEDTLADIFEQAGDEELSLKITEVDKTAGLNEQQRNAVGDNPVFDIKLLAGNTALTNFTGSLTFYLPYTLKEGELPENVFAWYVDKDGNVTKMEDSHYDAGTGLISFTTTHLSLYYVRYDAAAAVVVGGGDKGMSAGAGAGIAIGVIFATLAAAYIACYLLLYKKGKLTGLALEVIFGAKGATINANVVSTDTATSVTEPAPEAEPDYAPVEETVEIAETDATVENTTETEATETATDTETATATETSAETESVETATETENGETDK